MSTKKQIEDGKTIAIVAYLTWIGLVIAFIMNHEKKNEYAKFHLRQALLLVIIGVVGWIVFWIPVIDWLLAVALLILWIMGLVHAINGQETPLPIIGKLTQDWFKGL